MTDPRLGGGLLAAVQRLRTGSGVIVRHYHLPEQQRAALLRDVRRICRRRGHFVFWAGNERQAIRCHADGFHSRSGPAGRSKLPRSAPVHDVTELAQAKRKGAQMILVSPLYATASHPGARPMGMTRFRRIAMHSGRAAIIVLGGMTAARGRMQDKRIVHGWAGISAYR
ncbi:thiamine phosphate synthase [Sphingorhabdus arenilitoris]|uniref:Thiamine phosphate synthase n=1 Tax=Sphingorhabdus arenilitoris TaxID=1490041 RepID=A0ABV8RJZ2_9SPHN